MYCHWPSTCSLGISKTSSIASSSCCITSGCSSPDIVSHPISTLSWLASGKKDNLRILMTLIGFRTRDETLNRIVILQGLGMKVPAGLSAEQVAEAVGMDTRLHTINVSTQRPGPRLNLGEIFHAFIYSPSLVGYTWWYTNNQLNFVWTWITGSQNLLHKNS